MRAIVCVLIDVCSFLVHFCHAQAKDECMYVCSDTYCWIIHSFDMTHVVRLIGQNVAELGCDEFQIQVMVTKPIEIFGWILSTQAQEWVCTHTHTTHTHGCVLS